MKYVVTRREVVVQEVLDLVEADSEDAIRAGDYDHVEELKGTRMDCLESIIQDIEEYHH